MRRAVVKSSVLKSVGYDRDSKTLEIELVSGAVYSYFNVDEKVYIELINAPSHSAFFNSRIKGSYRFSKD